MSGRAKDNGPQSGEQAQQDEGYLAWLASMDYQVEMFVTLEVNGLPDDPFTREGLVVAEASLLDRIRDVETLAAPENRELWDGYARYVGETFVRRFNGTWENVPGIDGRASSPGVFTPSNPVPIQVFRDVRVAVRRRTGREWSSLYDVEAEDAARATRS